MYRNGTGGGPERDIVICVVPKWNGTEVDHPLVPNASGTDPVVLAVWLFTPYNIKVKQQQQQQQQQQQ